MREIKFRGRRIDNGDWVYGDYFKTPLTDENSGTKPESGWFFLTGEPRHCISSCGVVFVVDPETVGQFTGLRDRNGKEIYEGDVLRNDITEKNIGVVQFVDGGFWYVKDHVPYNILSAPCEVIGNVWENPELLKEQRT